ncbi:MAG: phosphoadenylyl-sulfate reductase [Planctomycetota bacterium]|nr:phosphoadenylyl-sulfate reductase [Planctomycetota bacterium]
MYRSAELARWQSLLRSFSPATILRWANRQFGRSLTFGSALTMEDQVLTSFISEQSLPISIFVLDTGRLHEASYTLLENTIQRYKAPIQLYFPDWEDIESMIGENGPNLFKQSVDLRKKCCFARKEKPLRRALDKKKAWITGLRREHWTAGPTLEPIEWDEARQLYKINPLWNWSREQLTNHVERNQVLVNPLHEQGFYNIGCEPCTRPIGPGEDPRDGQWWWESSKSKESELQLSASSTGPSKREKIARIQV